MSREERDGKPVWISYDECHECERVERQYTVVNLLDCAVLASVWDGKDFDPPSALGVSLFNASGFRVWTAMVPDVEDDAEAVVEAVRQMKLTRSGRIRIEAHGFDVLIPDAFEHPDVVAEREAKQARQARENLSVR